jgi:hypothetical protein
LRVRRHDRHRFLPTGVKPSVCRVQKCKRCEKMDRVESSGRRLLSHS